MQWPRSGNFIRIGKFLFFCEFFQRWLISHRKDAILEMFDLDRLDFQPFYEDRSDCISIIVPDILSRRRQCRALGFIKYEKQTGRVIIANPCAQLSTENLELGNSSKRHKDNLAGCHGEGLKLAALVMARNGYHLKLFASNSHWGFSFLGSRFCCVVKPSETIDNNHHHDPVSDMAQLCSRVERDITVVIEAMSGKPSQKVPISEFHNWLKVSLDIRGFSYPADILETEVGDLILDSDFQGRIYLKGMLLPAAASELKQYRFAYNFSRGRVNRDRQILADRNEEADIVRQIWEAAIRKHKVALLPIYVNLLRNFPEALDVESAAHLLEQSTRKIIWKHLLHETAGERFLYNEASNAKVS